MNRKSCAVIVSLMLLSLPLGVPLAAQEKPKPEAPRKTLVPLKLQVVFTRFLGEKKVSSLPYTLTVNANGRPARLRMGLQVPVQVTANNTTTVAFKDAANNVDCSAESMDDGRFQVNCSIEQSSIYAGEGARPISPATPDSPMQTPVLRTFGSTVELLLRDGQMQQYTTATDPVSGELLKIEVTLTVIK